MIAFHDCGTRHTSHSGGYYEDITKENRWGPYEFQSGTEEYMK